MGRKLRRRYRQWRGRAVCVDKSNGAVLVWRDSITTVYGHRRCQSCQGTGYLPANTTELHDSGRRDTVQPPPHTKGALK